MGLMPRMFARRFYEDVVDSVQLLDPSGNRHLIGIRRVDGSVYMTEGWTDLGIFYGLIFGGWLKLLYLSRGRFLIRVITNYGDEVDYPREPIMAPGEEEEPPALNEEAGFEDPPENYHPMSNGDIDFSHTVVKTITYADIVNGALLLPSYFCKRALTPGRADFKLIDEAGRRWNCQIREDIGDARQYRLTGGWDHFRRFKGLIVGDVVIFGVYAERSDALHFCRDW